MKPPTIRIWFADGLWHARSSNNRQGSVSGNETVVTATVAAWMQGKVA